MEASLQNSEITRKQYRGDEGEVICKPILRFRKSLGEKGEDEGRQTSDEKREQRELLLSFLRAPRRRD